MILEGLISVIFSMGKFLLALVPDIAFETLENSASLQDALVYVYVWVPQDVILVAIGHIVIYMTVGLSYAVIEFVIKKLPFLGIK